MLHAGARVACSRVRESDLQPARREFLRAAGAKSTAAGGALCAQLSTRVPSR
jgi:hypothetical protein